MTAALPLVVAVDDEQAVLDGLRRSLRGHVELLTATGGEEALALLAQHPEVAVVLSDMRMSGMDGARLLSRVREGWPHAARLLLTGFADVDAAMRVVNEAQVLRFLCKPCSPDDLRAAIHAGVELWRLSRAERELLEDTLRGAVRALGEALAAARPGALVRGERVREVAVELSRSVPGVDAWELEVASTLSELSLVSVPDDVARKVGAGEPLAADEEEMVRRGRARAAAIVRSIPRLERIGDLVEELGEERPSSPAATVLHAAALVERQVRTAPIGGADDLASRVSAAMRHLRLPESADRGAVRAVVERQERRHLAPVRVLPVDRLEPGMVLVAEVRSDAGILLMGAGQVLSEALIERLQNHADGDGGRRFRVRLESAPEAGAQPPAPTPPGHRLRSARMLGGAR